MRRAALHAHSLATALTLCALALPAGLGLGLGCARPRPDPLESLNRPVFALNEGADALLWDPLRSGYEWLTPRFVEDAFANLFRTQTVPGVLVNDLLQAKPLAVGEDLLRYVTNLTLGLGGMIDAASWLGLPENDEDFGQTIGRWGLTGPGPYLVFPALGSSSTREAVSVTLDFALAPWNYSLAQLARDAPHRAQRRRIDAAYAAERERRGGKPLDYYAYVRIAYQKDVARRTRDEEGFDPPTEDELRLMAPDEGTRPWEELGQPAPEF